MVRKEDVIKTLDERDEQAYTALAKAIDQRLPAYDGSHPVSVVVPMGASDKVIARIIKDYGAGGWTVRREKGDGPRGDCWDTLVFS